MNGSRFSTLLFDAVVEQLVEIFQSSRPVLVKQFKQSTTVFRYYLSIASRGYILPSLIFV